MLSRYYGKGDKGSMKGKGIYYMALNCSVKKQIIVVITAVY